MVSKGVLFSFKIPPLACHPDDALYSVNRQDWANKWSECLYNDWAAAATAAGSKLHTLEVKYTPFPPPTKCALTPEDLEPHRGMFCRMEGIIYMDQAATLSALEAKLVLFHEFGHFLQMSQGTTLDSNLFIADLHEKYPEKQTESAAILSEKNRRRRELSAECTAVAMLNVSGQLASASDKQFVTDYARQPEAVGGSSPKYYGTTDTRTKLFEKARTATTMQACNTWSMPDEEVQ